MAWGHWSHCQTMATIPIKSARGLGFGFLRQIRFWLLSGTARLGTGAKI